MDAPQFDQIARRVFAAANRRRVLGALGGLVAAPLLGGTRAEAKKKKKPVCLNGDTVKAAGKKRKKLIKRGATPGACPTVACTVTCTGTPVACGAALQRALNDGGNIVACPGLYQGPFTLTKSATLTGAGSGDNPASSTILDGQDGDGATLQASGAIMFTLSGVRVTGGTQRAGLLTLEQVDARVNSCTFSDNYTGIEALGKLQLANSTVSGNGAGFGGGLYLYGPGPYFVDNCVISENRASLLGGGVFIGALGSAADVTITGTRIQGNTAGSGGGIHMSKGPVRLDSATTITNNTATGTGGGVNVAGGTFVQNGANISGNNAPTQPNCAGVSCT
ncbi:MAG: hypothetical protein KC442_08140 [Thermomicrobiales bacterium]|nr:hypothetical protein [Thermomicrobiales bacterium]